jgi:phosphoribosylglycinamide formyltransferase-1
MSNLRLGILGSTRGTDMLAIIAAIQKKELAASIEIVVSNKSDAEILTKAQSYEIPALYLDPKTMGRNEYDKNISALMQKNKIDLIILIGYMKILSPTFVATWRDKIINVHPSLLPAFAGGMDQDVHQAVIASGATVSGCTVHYVTEDIDAGPILIQKSCAVHPGDTPDILKLRVQDLEGKALVEAIATIAAASHAAVII